MGFWCLQGLKGSVFTGLAAQGLGIRAWGFCFLRVKGVRVYGFCCLGVKV